MRFILLFLILLLLLPAARLRAGGSPAAEMLRRYTAAVAERLPGRVAHALARINDPARRLLAIRYYLNRSDSEIVAKWAWSPEEIEAFRRSDLYGTTIFELRKVQHAFEERNPGYALDVRMEIRTLGDQIHKWNNVGSVGSIAAMLHDTLMRWMADSTTMLDSVPTPVGMDCFVVFLRSFQPPSPPTVAVPGLSQHGQLRAFDFRIRRRGRVVAGGSSDRIAREWDLPGWTARLHEAICAVSDRFSGPLEEPYEPWHYAFVHITPNVLAGTQ
ncbi:MAG TPA: hypothetical protein VHI13_11885 [Candidatus Kapabacteria bacterium]|nr:hypothetical protein [Candidatus Kapabacteria bacterium]